MQLWQELAELVVLRACANDRQHVLHVVFVLNCLIKSIYFSFQQLIVCCQTSSEIVTHVPSTIFIFGHFLFVSSAIWRHLLCGWVLTGGSGVNLLQPLFWGL